MEQFDVVIIGAGPAGYVGAIKAAQLGKRVALIEEEHMGGTCLNRGCIPTKTLLHSAQVFAEQKHFDALGITCEKMQIDASKMQQRKEEVVARLRSGIVQLLQSNKVCLFNGTAKIHTAHMVCVNEECLQTEHILIASGSRVSTLPITGIEHALTSDDVLDFGDKRFTSVAIIGGGVVGCEFAALYEALGSSVSVLEAQQRILMNADKEISTNLHMIFKKRGVEILTQASVQCITEEGNQKKVVYQYKNEQKELIADAVILAAGRMARNVESVVSLTCERSRYIVNDTFQTNIPTIYAVGDASSKVQLAHVASYQAMCAVSHMFQSMVPPHEQYYPSCVYTSPEVAWCGMSEAEAVAAGHPVSIGKYVMLGNGKTMIEQQDRGFIKVVADTATRRILGCQMMCDRASDMIVLFVQALCSALTVDDMVMTMYPHPSFSEGILEALEDVDSHAVHIMPKSKRN